MSTDPGQPRDRRPDVTGKPGDEEREGRGPTMDTATLDRATRTAAVAFTVAMLAGVGLVAVYLAGGQTQVEGGLLFLAFGGVAVGLTIWAKALLDEPDLVEERHPMRSAEEERQAFERAYMDAMAGPDPRKAPRRRFLSRLLAGAGASLAVALLLPFRSLGEAPGRDLFRTAWRDGVRLVGYDGQPFRPEDMNVGAVETVFPEGNIGSGDSQALLIGVDMERLRLASDAPPTVDGVVCYSKVCTHAGCPVGLYRASVGELLCPCHQSKFDAWTGAEPLSGPTTRPLPQLPLGVDDGGYLVALGDFEEPVGPAFWNMNFGPDDGDDPGGGDE